MNTKVTESMKLLVLQAIAITCLLNDYKITLDYKRIAENTAVNNNYHL